MKTIALIGAMPSELHDVRTALPDATCHHHAGFDYYESTRDNVRIIFATSGIAKVNAALCTQVMIDTFSPDAILNIGVAGGGANDIHLCDIVISTAVTPHDLDPHFLKDYPPYCAVFPADTTLITLAEETCAKFDYTAHKGLIASGEAFIADDAVKEDIMQRLSPAAMDMESAAVGHCAYLNGTPFVSIRCISDNADDNGEMSFEAFEKIAAQRVAQLALALAPKI